MEDYKKKSLVQEDLDTLSLVLRNFLRKEEFVNIQI